MKSEFNFFQLKNKSKFKSNLEVMLMKCQISKKLKVKCTENKFQIKFCDANPL